MRRTCMSFVYDQDWRLARTPAQRSLTYQVILIYWNPHQGHGYARLRMVAASQEPQRATVSSRRVWGGCGAGSGGGAAQPLPGQAMSALRPMPEQERIRRAGTPCRFRRRSGRRTSIRCAAKGGVIRTKPFSLRNSALRAAWQQGGSRLKPLGRLLWVQANHCRQMRADGHTRVTSCKGELCI